MGEKKEFSPLSTLDMKIKFMWFVDLNVKLLPKKKFENNTLKYLW